MTFKKRILECPLIMLFSMFFFFASSQNCFVENKGQLPNQVVAKLNLPSGSLFIENRLLKYAFYSGQHLKDVHDLIKKDKVIDAHAYTATFLNTFNSTISEFYEESKYFENFYIGDSSNWASNVRSYKYLIQRNIYNGIDVKYFTEAEMFKYDIIIAPNINPNQIAIRYDGVDLISLFQEKITIKTNVNTITEFAPYAFQIINDKKIEVICNYILDNNILSFDFPEGYNKSYELVIDPLLEFSTYSGSSADNFGYTATYDNYGFLYSGSTSFSSGYPVTLGAYQINYANSIGGTDIAITKYDTSGTARIFSTYLGGNLDELPHSMIVNSSNELFIYGTTASSDFPTSSLSYQPYFNGGVGFSPSGIGVSFPNGSDIFVSRLSAGGGNLLASTFIGGSGNDGLNTSSKLRFNYADEVRGEIDIDNNNNIYIATCTQSLDFPTLNSFQTHSIGSQEGCIIKMDNQLSSIIWSSYLGGSNDDAIYSLALDHNDDIYVTGGTTSHNFPTSTGAYENTYQDSLEADAFITKISSDGTQIMHSSYFGSNLYDQSYFVEIGNTNSIYLFGQTMAEGFQLVNNSSYFIESGGQFIAVFDDSLSTVIRSTVVGSGKGTPDISPTAFLVDVCDKIYIAGWGSNLGGGLSTLNLPANYNSFQQSTDGNDMFLMVLDEYLSSVTYSTYFGGSQSSEHVDGGTSRFDKKGIIYQSVCAGCGGNSDFPIKPNPGAVSLTNNSTNCNNGVFKFNFNFPIIIADFGGPLATCDTSVAFQNLTNTGSAVTYFWDFGDGNFSTDFNPIHNYSERGFFEVTLIASDLSSCNISDTVVKSLYILSNSSDTILGITKCPFDQLQIGLVPVDNPLISYSWTPTNNLSSINASNPFTNIESTQQYVILISDGVCSDTLFQNIIVTDLQLDLGPDTVFCNDAISLYASYSPNITSIHWASNRYFTDTLSLANSLEATYPSLFYAKVSDGFCNKIDSVLVSIESIDIQLFADDVCLGDSVVIGASNLNTDSQIIYYDWNATNLSTDLFIDYPDTSRWYSVKVIDENMCTLEDSIFVYVYPYPTIDSLWITDDIIYSGVSFYVYISSNIGNDSILAILDDSYWVSAEIENEFGCFSKDSIWVDVTKVVCSENNIIIPTGFTPFSSDGKNDTYYIKELVDDVIIEFYLEIFNRYGQKVFATKIIEERWDGTFNGDRLTPQVFDFYINIKCIGGESFFHKGNITLIR